MKCMLLISIVMSFVSGVLLTLLNTILAGSTPAVAVLLSPWNSKAISFENSWSLVGMLTNPYVPYIQLISYILFYYCIILSFFVFFKYDEKKERYFYFIISMHYLCYSILLIIPITSGKKLSKYLT